MGRSRPCRLVFRTTAAHLQRHCYCQLHLEQSFDQLKQALTPIAKSKFALVSLVTVAHLTHLLLQRNRPTIAVPTAFVTVALSPTCHHKFNPNFALTGKKDGPSYSCTNRGPQSNYSTFPHLGTQLQSSIEFSQPCQLFVYTPKAPAVYSARKSCCPLCTDTTPLV